MSNDIFTVTNLIDLSTDEGLSSTSTDAAHPSNTSTLTPSLPLIPIGLFDGRESLENNPFDCVQKQANRPDDPFDLISREASSQPHSCESFAGASKQVEVRTANLLCISDDNIKTDEETSQPVVQASQFCEMQVPSSRFIEPISSTPEGAAPQMENSDSSTNKGRSQKSLDARKRLLKLSLSNSTSNSPLCRRPLDEDNSSPLSSVCSEAENLANQFASKFGFDSSKSFDDSCDDIMSIVPNWIDSETDIDSDLELMKIPILQEMASPVVPTKSMTWDDAAAIETPPLPISCKNSPDLEALREKVQQHKAEKNKNNEIASLIENLKQVITNCADNVKKAEANNLLESLSNLMNDKNASGASAKMDTLTPPPQPIIRQGTFDMDIKDNEEREERRKEEEDAQKQDQEDRDRQDLECENEADKNISSGTHSLHSPDQPDVSDIVEQIGRLIGNQNVNVVQTNLSTNNSGNTIMNPTYIVVMNTPIPVKQRPSINPIEYQNDGSPELSYSQVRRRSQSLSIHDKEKVFAAPEPPSPLPVECKTPGRASMVRRNSFSSATLPSTPNIQLSRRSFYGAGGNTTADMASKPSQMQRRSMALETHHEKQQNAPQQKPSLAMGSISFNAKKLKFKQSTESIVKAVGPMKATIPVKKVAPMIVTTNADSPPIDQIMNNFKSVTSTPNVQQFPSKSFPNACSTPMIEASPIKRSGLVKSRYSFVAATPATKQSSLAPSSSPARRRTMSEMRSPKKFGDKPSSSGISKPGSVKTVKLPQNFSKTLNKMAPNTPKGVLRLTKSSTSTSVVEKNKENKLPRTGR